MKIELDTEFGTYNWIVRLSEGRKYWEGRHWIISVAFVKALWEWYNDRR